MANEAAWTSGWQQGSDQSKKDKDKKDQSNQGKPQSSGGNPWSILSYLPRLHKGGKVKRTGGYLLRKGEIVLTPKQAQKHGIKSGRKKSHGHKRVSAKG